MKQREFSKLVETCIRETYEELKSYHEQNYDAIMDAEINRRETYYRELCEIATRALSDAERAALNMAKHRARANLKNAREGNVSSWIYTITGKSLLKEKCKKYGVRYEFIEKITGNFGLAHAEHRLNEETYESVHDRNGL